VQLAQVFYHILNWIFSFQNLVFWNFIWIFKWQKSLKKSISPNILNPNLTKINSIKSWLIKIFPTTSKAHSNSSEIFSYNLIWFNFQWKNHSIFKNFCTTSPDIMMEPSRPCTTPPHPELSKDTQNTTNWSISQFGGSHITTKQNKLPSFIDSGGASQVPFVFFSCNEPFWLTHHNNKKNQRKKKAATFESPPK